MKNKTPGGLSPEQAAQKMNSRPMKKPTTVTGAGVSNSTLWMTSEDQMEERKYLQWEAKQDFIEQERWRREQDDY